jgi:SAM-dependent methyltransferase
VGLSPIAYRLMPREHASCGACGADDAFLLFTSPDRRNPNSGQIFPVGRCRRCGHAYVLERPCASEISSYYPADYVQHARAESPKRARKPKRHRRLRLTPGLRLLDVGCGTGYDLLKLKPLGIQLFGVETHPEATAVARSAGIAVFQGAIECADFPDRHFHRVTMNHCLEHFHEPAAALVNIRRMTHPDGSIHLAFPTASGMNFRIFRARWAHLDVPRHLHFFTHESFVKLIRGCGLRMVHRICRSGTRGFRHSLRSAPLLHGMLSRRPGVWFLRAAMAVVDALRQGDVAEYILRP